MSDILDLSKNIPSWINENFLQKIYKNSKVSNVKVASATKPGDNFVGAVYRVNFTLETNEKSEEGQLILKTPTNVEAGAALSYLVDDFVEKLFHTELQMYREILPEMKKLWKSAGYKDLLSPNHIYQEMEPNLTILLEDVSPYGYKIHQLPPEDFEVSVMIAKRLAKFHASSFYMVNEKKTNLIDFNVSLFANPILADVVPRVGLEAFMHVAEEKEQFIEYLEALKSIKETFFEKIKKLLDNSDDDGLKVLNHSDFHNKNVLFKEVDGKIVDFYIIDFQVCNFASPAIDLIYAIYHFISTENREQHRDEFISIYHHQFVKTLNDFNYCGKLPTLKSIYDELLKFGLYEVVIAICLTVFYYSDVSQLKDEDLSKIEGIMNARIKMCRTEKYLKMLEWQLKELREKGVL